MAITQTLQKLTTLNRLGIGEQGCVSGISCSDHELRNKLLTMGVVQDTEVRVTNVAPLGDPISVLVRGFKLCLRLSEAESVQITRP